MGKGWKGLDWKWDSHELTEGNGGRRRTRRSKGEQVRDAFGALDAFSF